MLWPEYWDNYRLSFIDQKKNPIKIIKQLSLFLMILVMASISAIAIV